MSDECVPADAEIRLSYRDDFYTEIEERSDPDGWAEILILIGDTHVLNPEYNHTGLAYTIISNLIKSVCRTHAAEDHLIVLDYGPSYIFVAPRDDHTNTVTYCVFEKHAYNPSKRLDIERSLPVTKQAWTEAVLEIAKDFRETVITLAPDLRDNAGIGHLSGKITELEALIAANSGNAE